jgi:ATP-dependent DNA helicase RecQ
VEWCRDARRRQHGLLLVTAHSAKGLQFDHVAVLDGDWMRYGKGEDPDAPRRLYYVSMTRARQSLLLARGGGRDRSQRDGGRRGREERGHAGGHLLDELQPGPAVVFRDAAEVGDVPPALRRVRRRLAPDKVDIGFAGRFAPSRPVHAHIAGLAAGDGLTLRDSDGRWELHDAAANRVGRLAKAFTMPAGMRCTDASVAAVLVRSEDDSPPEYREQLRCARWEVVIPELVLEPVQGAVDYERRRGVSQALHGERLVADR